MTTRRVTCGDFEPDRIHGECPDCINPKGVALVPFRPEGDIRAGDVIQFTLSPDPLWGALPGYVHQTAVSPAAHAVEAYGIRRLA